VARRALRTYGTLSWKDGQWTLAGEPHLLLFAKRLFPRMKEARAAEVSIHETDEVSRNLEWLMDRYPLKITPAFRRRLLRGARRHEDTILLLEKMLGEKYKAREFRMALPLRDYQKIPTEILLKRKSLLLADELGLGKTVEALAALSLKGSLPAAVVTLTALPTQWAEEVERFIPDLHCHVVKKATPYELPRKDGRGPDIIVLNYHKLFKWADVLAKHVRTVVFDECQELRRSESRKYEAAVRLAEECTYKLGMSGTPIYNWGGEIWNVLNVIDPDALGSRHEFLREWCTGNDDKASLMDPKAFGTYLRENFIMLRRTRSDVGRELPPLSKIIQSVEADGEALDRIEGSAAELARIILSKENLDGWDRLRAHEQFDALLRQATGIGKAPYVADFVRLLVEADEEPVVLFGWHRAVYDLWLAQLKDLKPLMFTGSETAAEKMEARRAFMAGESKLLIMSLRAGAGLDGLQKVCRTVVVGELDWSHGVHEQNVGRIFRDGQKDPVTAYFMVTDGGSDPMVAETLGLKREQLEGIRDPHHEILEELGSDQDRVKKLAARYLEKVKKSSRSRKASATPSAVPSEAPSPLAASRAAPQGIP
jgi:SNF2 family DNA or RNA helicase